MVLMNYTHGKDENSWSTVTVGYVSATVDSAYSYITSGTCFYTYIWEYNGKYSSSFNSTYYGNKKLISCIRDYKHSADENGDSTVSFVYMNCMI